MSNPTYKRLLIMSAKLGFRVSVDWDTMIATIIPGHHALGRMEIGMTLDMSQSPEKAAEAFGKHYKMSPERVSELSDPSEVTLTRRPRVAARKRAGRSIQEEKSNGKQEAREE